MTSPEILVRAEPDRAGEVARRIYREFGVCSLQSKPEVVDFVAHGSGDGSVDQEEPVEIVIEVLPFSGFQAKIIELVRGIPGVVEVAGDRTLMDVVP